MTNTSAFNGDYQARGMTVSFPEKIVDSSGKAVTDIPFSEFVPNNNNWMGVAVKFKVQGLDEAGANLGAECASNARLMSPIVLEFSGANDLATSHFADAKAPQFDLNADGKAETTGWTKSATSGFLALDLNHNGKIDSGK